MQAFFLQLAKETKFFLPYTSKFQLRLTSLHQTNDGLFIIVKNGYSLLDEIDLLSG